MRKSFPLLLGIVLGVVLTFALRGEAAPYITPPPPAGGGGAPTSAGYWVTVADGTLSAEQAMGALATGIVKNTTTTGVPSIAVAGVDYSAGTSALATGIVKSTTTTGALSIAVAGTDYQAAGSYYATVQDEGGALTQRTTLNFTGAGVSCVDNAGSTRTDCTIAGGGGSPGGSSGQVQYNNASAFAGAANVSIDANGNLNLPAVSDPAAPAAGTLTPYVKDIAGRMMPKWIGPSGLDTPFQPFIGFNRARLWAAGGGTSATTVLTATGVGYTASATTYAQTTAATGSLRSRTRLATLASSTTAGNVASVRTPQLEVSRETGFFYTWRGGLAGTLQTGMRAFFGLWASASAATNVDPTTDTTAKVGFALNASTGNLKFVNATGGSAPTVLDLTSLPLNTTDLWELVLFCAPGGSSIGYRITNLSTAATQSGSLTTNLPGSTVYLAVQNWATNNATAAAVTWAISSMYLETDY